MRDETHDLVFRTKQGGEQEEEEEEETEEEGRPCIFGERKKEKGEKVTLAVQQCRIL